MPYLYSYQMGWTLQNNTGQPQTVKGFYIKMDNAEAGYWWGGSFQVLLNGEQVRTGSGTTVGELNGLSVDLDYFGGPVEVPDGASIKINAIAENSRWIGGELDMFMPAGWSRTPDNAFSGTRLSLHVLQQTDPNAPSGPVNSPADISGMEYFIDPAPHQVFAKVTRWSYPPLFGLKVLVPPPAPPQLFYPTTYGPNYEGRCGGMLLLPAVVTSVRDEGGGIRDIECAGVKLTFSPAGAGDISSSVAVGILPYPDGGG